MASVKRPGSLKFEPVAISSSRTTHNPTPLEFDRFIPWAVMRGDSEENVQVNRITIEEDPSQKFKKQAMMAFSKVNVSRANTDTCTKASVDSVKTNSGSSISNAENTTTITAYYTNHGQLTEVAFVKCQMPVPSIVLDAIHLCLPYHPQLTRITWNGHHLTGTVICEIAKMFMDSFLTDVVLDNSCVPEKNYYFLLNSVNLKYLSLRCCQINDEACEKIAERMQRNRPGENLVALNLSVNLITDKGAKALGYALRTNRRLSFLNLCCNSITSDGAAHILLPLTKFPLNPDEIMDAKETRMELAKQKIVANKVYLGDITNFEKKAGKKKRQSVSVPKGQVQTEKTTDTRSERIRAKDDIFLANLELSSGVWFSLGNVTLCSLNLAYNRLDIMAVSQIADVLSYQFCEYTGPRSGLMRVVIEGNLLPKECPKYRLIDKYMRLALHIPSDMTENFGKSSRSLHNLNKSKFN